MDNSELEKIEQTNDNPIAEKGDWKEEIIEDIGKDLKEQQTEEEPTGDSPSRDLNDAPIPDEFSKVASAAGFTNDEIEEFASNYTDEELMNMIPYLSEEEAEEKEEDIDDEKKTEKPTEEPKGKDAELKAQLIKEAKEDLLKEFGTDLDEIKRFKESQQEKQDADNLKLINKKFDDFNKEFTVFGKTDELPRFPVGKFKGKLILSSPEVQARNEVFGYATTFIKDGRPVDEAMDYALALYKGRNLETETKRSVIKDLKKHEQMLSGSRTGKETKKTYASDRDEMIDDIRMMQKSIGQDV